MYNILQNLFFVRVGRVMCALRSTTQIVWGAEFDAAIREVWTMMEEYVEVRHGKDCKNLRLGLLMSYM